MKWVTRRRIQVNRAATAWLVKRFLEPEAEFVFVDQNQVAGVQEREGAVGFDAPGATYPHQDAHPRPRPAHPRAGCAAPDAGRPACPRAGSRPSRSRTALRQASGPLHAVRSPSDDAVHLLTRAINDIQLLSATARD